MSPADLFVLLDREFRRRKPRECASCYVPLPYRIDPPLPNLPNWEIVSPGRCPLGCDLLLEELVSSFQERYELAAKSGRGG